MHRLLLLGLVCCSSSGDGGAISTTAGAAPGAATLKANGRPLPTMPPTSLAPFTEAGCTRPFNERTTIERGETMSLDCSRSPTFAKLGCTEVELVGLLAALAPARPIARCDLSLPGPGRGYSGYVQPKAELVELGTVGCMSPRAVRYVVRDGTEWKTVGRLREIEALFAPIDSPEEALSWALLRARSDGYALATIEVPPNVSILASEVDTTYAETASGGFHVRLFQSKGCGCHPQWLSALDVLVGTTGTIRVDRTTPIYRGTGSVCAD